MKGGRPKGVEWLLLDPQLLKLLNKANKVSWNGCFVSICCSVMTSPTPKTNKCESCMYGIHCTALGNVRWALHSLEGIASCLLRQKRVPVLCGWDMPCMLHVKQMLGACCKWNIYVWFVYEHMVNLLLQNTARPTDWTSGWALCLS